MTDEERYRRMETRLDELLKWASRFEVDVTNRLTRIETRDEGDTRYDSTRVSDRSFFWMKVGMVSSFLVGVASVVAKALGW
jgi:hypothetical protein